MKPRAWIGLTFLAAAVLLPASAVAQDNALGGIGIGPRLTFVRGADSTEDRQRFSGASLRLRGAKFGLDLAMDFRSGVVGDDLTERFRDYPIQASLLVFPIRARLSPYLLGGVGWYTQSITTTTPGDTLPDSETTRTMGYHAGLGAEARLHRRIGIYLDYRYSMLRFGGDDDDPSRTHPRLIPFSERLGISHEGSMFTLGGVFYF